VLRSDVDAARSTAIVAVAVAVAATVLVLAACGGTAPEATGRSHVVSTPSTAAPGSHVTMFDPYAANGTPSPSIHVAQTLGGTCVNPGVAGATSYRCFAQPSSTVYDPCFAPPHATSGPLLCVADPAQPEAVSFDVGALPARATSAPATQAWAMELATGQTCILVSAAWEAGVGPFACPTPSTSPPSEADCHAPRQSATRSTAQCQTSESSSSPFRTVQVVTIWT
jgi:hypothetical protein